jgi:hypothetical protein
MLIRMLIQMPEGAARNGEPWPAKGTTADLPSAEAAHLIAAGVAEAVTEPRRARRRAPAEEED